MWWSTSQPAPANDESRFESRLLKWVVGAGVADNLEDAVRDNVRFLTSLSFPKRATWFYVDGIREWVSDMHPSVVYISVRAGRFQPAIQCIQHFVTPLSIVLDYPGTHSVQKRTAPLLERGGVADGGNLGTPARVICS